MEKIDRECSWFDIHNPEHINAYKHLSKTGTWPKGFVTDSIVLPALWLTIIQARMAEAYTHSVWEDKRIRQTKELSEILTTLSQLNNGSDFIGKLQHCINISKSLTKTNLRDCSPSFDQFLISKAHGE